jgi:hypothetical protein
MAYVKRPKKDDLYEEIARLERENQKLVAERDRDKIKRWNDLLPVAYEVCRKQLNQWFPNILINLHFEHVDEGGYWFTFQLINDARTQTFAVRHTDLQ